MERFNGKSGMQCMILNYYVMLEEALELPLYSD